MTILEKEEKIMDKLFYKNPHLTQKEIDKAGTAILQGQLASFGRKVQRQEELPTVSVPENVRFVVYYDEKEKKYWVFDQDLRELRTMDKLPENWQPYEKKEEG